MTKFFADGEASDPSYVMWRDEPCYAVGRERVERLWSRYEPFCPDHHFLVEAKAHFLQRTWEMHLACVLMDHGPALRKPPPTGPDICIDSDPPIWVEAVAVGPGEGADRVQSREERQYEDGTDDPNVWAGDLPSEESLILRCTNALETKLSAFRRYRKAGVVAERDSCIVAISFAAIDDAFYFFNYAEIPIVIKALFGIGRDMLSYAREGDAPPRWFHPHRPRTTKNSGTAVLANVFSAGHANEISGVFATAWDLANSSDSGEKLMFVNNPRARNVISPGTFPFGSEFIARDGNIARQHWSPFNPLTGGPWPLPAG
jgi:hypothetical protein